jgi:hypothetical protein
MTQLNELDLELRGSLTRQIAILGHAPTKPELAKILGRSPIEIDRSLRRLHDAQALLLHPHCCEPWVVHPFALSPGSCWVEVDERGWWANCVYCAMGVAAAVGSDAKIYTRLGGEWEPLIIEIRNGDVVESELILHLATPVRHWWDNVIHACASFQPFRNEAEIEIWCSRHAFPKGVVVPLGTMWRFASEWYGSYLTEPWHKRSRQQIADLFAQFGFQGDFWRV